MKQLFKFLLLIALPIFVNRIHTASITSLIDSPGIYTLGGNIIANPTDQNDVIITISSNNVILDLNGHFIEEQEGNFILLNGILVLPNFSNIIIKNGFILNLTGSGIFVSDGCSNIALENITTISCDRIGIECMGQSTNPISKISIDKCQTFSCGKFSAATIFAAMHLSNCNQSRINNCLLTANNHANFFTVLHLNNCNDSQFNNIQIKDNTAALGLVGVAMTDGSNNIFERCRVLSNESNGSFVWAFLLSGSFHRNVLLDCMALQNTCTAQSIGFLTNGTQTDLLLKGCQSLQNVGGTQAYGFLLQATSIRNNLIDCLAEGNTISTSATGTAIGFRIENSEVCKLLNCTAVDNVAGLGVGVDILHSTSCIIQECRAHRNIGNTDANSYGFRLNNGNILDPDLGNNIFISNYALSNGETLSNQMSNFISGSFLNVSYSLLSTVSLPFINLGIIA